jgi:oligoribonuclease NrnB/cAMP/cGMP phosphodiesterase (DHH superfamily)
MNNAIVIYHKGCADGFGAALAFYYRYGVFMDYHEGVYGEAPPDVKGLDVYMVDFSYKREVVEEMLKVAKSVTWIDHHKSAEADLKDVEGLIKIYDVEKSGCVLAWEFVYPKKHAPELLLRIQDRDLWKFELEGSKEVNAFLYSRPFSFSEWLWYINMPIDQIIEKGQALVEKQATDVARAVKATLRPMCICFHSVPTVNVNAPLASDAGNLLAIDAPFSASYYDTATHRNFSLRSSKANPAHADVSLVAAHYGGGGHKHAAGFKVERDHILAKS